MTPNHSDPDRPTRAARIAAWASWRALLARVGGIGLAALVVLGAPSAEAAGRPRLGWSSAPRWRLPRARPPECPRGYAHERGRSLVQVQKARCIETGPESQVARASTPRPTPPQPTQPGVQAAQPRPARPLPGVYDEPVRHLPSPREAGPRAPAGRVPTLDAGPDATALMRLSPSECLARLDALEVPYVKLERAKVPEVAIPVRLTGAVAGVDFTIPWSEDPEHDPHAIWDCRLVAAIVPLAEFLHAHGVTEVQYFSALRRGKIVRDKPRSQHNVGLALDLLGVRGPSRPLATIEQTYSRGQLRACPADMTRPGPLGAPVPTGASAADLFFALVCQAHARGLFHTLLTPDHDRAHYNHLHLDLKAGQPTPADPFTSFAE
jgi:hypothetical protein